MRKQSLVVCALGCGFIASHLACSSSKNGVEGSDVATGGAGFNTTGGANGNATGGVAMFGAGGSQDQAGGDTSTSPSTGCAQQNVSIQQLPPDIMIVMDRSTSMKSSASGQSCAGGDCGEDSKWFKSITAMKAVVQDTQNGINWGMFWLGNEAVQCNADTAPVVPITAGSSYSLIQAALDGNKFTGANGTPTAAAVKNATAYLKTLTDPNPKYILLATDGEPNCGSSGGAFGTDTVGTKSAITAALDAGIPTFVIGIATTNSTAANDALNEAAVAGGHPQTGAATKYYAVADTASLTEALSQIIGIAASCVISLDATPNANDWSIAIGATDKSGNVVEVPNNATDGWAYSDSSRKSITLAGSSCEKLKSGEYTDFKFVYTCKDQPIIF